MKLLSLFAACFLAVTAAFAEDPASFDVGGFTFKRPTDWTWTQVPPAMQAMRKAQLKVAGGEQSGDLVFYYFGESGGGDVKANVARWFGQFTGDASAQKTEEQTYGKTKVTFASTEGTFASGMPGGPSTAMKDYALLAAILEHSGGSVFLKFTGPAALVKANRQKFVDLVKDAAEHSK